MRLRVKPTLHKPVERSPTKLRIRNENITACDYANDRAQVEHGGFILSPMQKRQELLAGLSTGPHASQHAACRRGTANLLYATHDHA